MFFSCLFTSTGGHCNFPYFIVLGAEEVLYLKLFSLAFPVIKCIFMLAGNFEMAAKTRHHVAQCVSDDFQCSAHHRATSLLYHTKM